MSCDKRLPAASPLPLHLPRNLRLAISSDELATLLAALRHWQAALAASRGAVALSYPHFAEVRPLSRTAINALCERLNLSSSSPRSTD